MSGLRSRGRDRVKAVLVDHFEFEDDLRVAVLGDCPFCGTPGHRHSVPLDALSAAPLQRTPRCGGQRGDYRLVLGPTTS